MSKLVTQYAVAKFAPKIANIGSEDPYFAEAEVETKNGKKVKKVKKPIPANISPDNAKILKKFRKRAYALDLQFSCCCGIKLGWAGIIGLIPWVGDIIAVCLALMLVKKARLINNGRGVPAELYSKMMANVMIDFLIGLIPVVGDLINIAYKCNSRNCLILEHYLLRDAEAKLNGEEHIGSANIVELSNDPAHPGVQQQVQQVQQPVHSQQQQQQRQQQHQASLPRPPPAYQT